MTYVLVFVIVVMAFIIYKLNDKCDKLESYIGKMEDDYELTLMKLLEMYTEAHMRLLRVDKRGGFASDDEVGFIFNIIKNTVSDLKGRLEVLLQEDTEENK
jgi:hypothetical protein